MILTRVENRSPVNSVLRHPTGGLSAAAVGSKELSTGILGAQIYGGRHTTSCLFASTFGTSTASGNVNFDARVARIRSHVERIMTRGFVRSLTYSAS